MIYQKSIDFFTCRLPSFRHQLEEKINFFATEIHAFFSENTSALCYFSLEDLWCDWNRFLDLLLSNRTITYFNDEECPWDQFSLKIYEAAIDTYKIQATGQCYNETEWLKI